MAIKKVPVIVEDQGKNANLPESRILSLGDLAKRIMEDNSLTGKDLKDLEEFKKRIDSENEDVNNQKKRGKKFTKETLKNFLEDVIHDKFLFDRTTEITNEEDFKVFIVALKILGFKPLDKKGSPISWEGYNVTENYNNNITTRYNLLTNLSGTNQANIEDGHIATYKNLEFQREPLKMEQLDGFAIDTQVDYDYLEYSLKELGYDTSELLTFPDVKGNKVKLKNKDIILVGTKIKKLKKEARNKPTKIESPIEHKPIKANKEVKESVEVAEVLEPVAEPIQAKIVAVPTKSIKEIKIENTRSKEAEKKHEEGNEDDTGDWITNDLRQILDSHDNNLFEEIDKGKVILYLGDFLKNEKFKSMKSLESSRKSLELTLLTQLALTNLGYNLGKIDGIYKNAQNNKNNPSNTMKAIMKFQRNNNLKIDGDIGPKTAQAIIDNLKL